MNAYFALAAKVHVPPTGGTLRNIWGQLSFSKLTDGLSIQEINILTKD